MKSFILLFSLSNILFVSNVFADSDGSYCVGKDYVAVEAKGIQLDADRPSVYIVIIDSDGLLNKHIIDTPPNLNKKLSCEKDSILLSDGHQIELNKPTPKFGKFTIDPKVEFSHSQLPFIQESKIIKIPTTNQSFLYSLVINHNLDAPVQGLLLHQIHARVVQTTLTGQFKSSTLLAEGISIETIH